MNNCCFTVRLTKDPEYQADDKNPAKNLAKFTGAIKRQFTHGSDTSADFADFIAWGKYADFIHNYGCKGLKLEIGCYFRNNNYKNKDGKTVYRNDFVVTFVDFAESKNSETSVDRSHEGFVPLPSDAVVSSPELPFV